MTVLEIITYPDPRLKELCAEQETFDVELHTLLDNMYETMIVAAGIGLAAPQVGILKRVVVIDISDDRTERLELINPSITESSGETRSEEGCLSIPDYRDTIKRNNAITVTAFDRHGAPFTVKTDGLLSRCLQHEIDHLDGILFVDRMSRLKREYFKRWIKRHVQSESSS